MDKSAAEKPVVTPAAPAASKPAARKTAPAKAVPFKAAAKPARKPAVKADVEKKQPAKAAHAPKPAKPAAKAAPKASAKPAPKASAKPAPVQAEKPRKPKLVRDSFTMPEAEYAVLGQVKKAALKAGFEIKKSELLRVGVALISKTDIATLKSVLGSLPQLKTGRPKMA